MESETFRNLIVGKIAKKHQLDSYDLSKIRDYLHSVKITPNTSIKLAAEFHAKNIADMLVNGGTSNVSELSKTPIDIKAYQTNMLTDDLKGIPGSSSLYTASLPGTQINHLLVPVIVLELETLFQLEMLNKYELSKQIAPHSKMKYNYLMLDSWNCYEIPTTRDKFTWMLNDRNIVQQTGYINLHSILKNIKLARLGRMTFAHIFDNVMDLFSSGRRITFGFDEFASQALIAPNGTKFQFLEQLRPSDEAYGSTYTLSSYDQNRGWFRFRERFELLDKLSLNIWDLFGLTATRISIPDSYLTFTGVQYYGFTVTNGFESVTEPLEIANFQKYLPMIWTWTESDRKEGPGISAEQFTLSGYTTLDPVGEAAIIAAYNSTHFLERVFDNYFKTPSPLGTHTPFTTQNITITVLWKPRFTGVLELVSEDDDDSN
jgi:hypothetical protein